MRLPPMMSASQKNRTRYNRWWAVLPALIVVAGILCTFLLAVHVDQEMRDDLLDQARLLAETVNVEQIRSLTGTTADLETPAYLCLKEQLAAVRGIYPTCRFIYLMGRHPDGTVFFYADSEPAGSLDESPPRSGL